MTPSSSPSFSRHLRTVGFLLAIGGAFLTCTLVSDRIVPLGAFEGCARCLYRVVSLVRLPAYPFLIPFVRPSDRHEPESLSVASSLLAPFLWYTLWRIVKRTNRALTHRLLQRSGNPSDTSESRRRFLITTGSLPVLLCGGLAAYGSAVEPVRLKVRRYRVGIRDLPTDLEGFRMIHVSDTHYGPFTSKNHIRKSIELANSLKGDLVVLTGDYVHRTPRSVEPGIELLASLKGRLGVLAVIGNHEHWEGADHCRAVFRRIGIPLIDGRHVFVTPRGISESPDPGSSICVGGVGDLWEDEVDLEKALGGVPDDMPRIVLAHNPDTAEIVPAGVRVDLMCSGHTHGGQVRVPFLGTPIVPSGYGSKYAGGLCRGPHCRVIVSRGVGMAILPVRFGIPPEIGVIELIREPAA